MEDIKQVRKDVHRVLALFTVCKALLVLTQRFLGPVLFGVLHRIFGDDSSRIFLEFSSYATPAGLILEIAISVFCLFVPVCFYFLITGRKYARIVPSQQPELLQICFGVGTTIIVGSVASIAGNIILSSMFSSLGMEDIYNAMLESDTAYPSNIWLVPLFVLIFAILPAFLEEILMRGIGISATRRLGTLFTLFFSGFFFAFMHGTWIQIPFAFVVGFVLAYFTLRFNTIWIAVISHFVFNFNSAVQCLILQNSGDFADLFSIIWSTLFFTLMIGFMVAGLIIYGIKCPNLPKSDFRVSQKMKIMLSSPFFYVFILLEVYQLIYLLTIY